MIDNEVSFTSLCYITVDYEGRIWLNRLADVEDDILHTPFKSERTDNYFENRDRLYRNDGPIKGEMPKLSVRKDSSHDNGRN